MAEGGFQLDKWHSNIPEKEAPLSASGNALASTVSPAYAKILGIPWNKTGQAQAGVHEANEKSR